MNKAQLVETIALSHGMTRVNAGAALEAVLTTVRATLQKGDTVMIQGFGTFTVKTRAARVGRNPKTGESVQIPEKKAVHWKPSAGLLG